MYLPREVKGTHGDTNYRCILFVLQTFFANIINGLILSFTLSPTTRKVCRVGVAVQELRAASSSL